MVALDSLVTIACAGAHLVTRLAPDACMHTRIQLLRVSRHMHICCPYAEVLTVQANINLGLSAVDSGFFLVLHDSIHSGIST